jgi:hypothetical protein
VVLTTRFPRYTAVVWIIRVTQFVNGEVFLLLAVQELL